MQQKMDHSDATYAKYFDEHSRFKKGNPGRPKGASRNPKRFFQNMQKLIGFATTKQDVLGAVRIILMDMLQNYSPEKFRQWLRQPENETLFYTRILPRFFPAHLDIQLDAEVSHRLSYELVLPQLIEAKEKGLLKSHIGPDGLKYIDFEMQPKKIAVPEPEETKETEQGEKDEKI